MKWANQKLFSRLVYSHLWKSMSFLRRRTSCVCLRKFVKRSESMLKSTRKYLKLKKVISLESQIRHLLKLSNLEKSTLFRSGSSRASSNDFVFVSRPSKTESIKVTVRLCQSKLSLASLFSSTAWQGTKTILTKPTRLSSWTKVCLSVPASLIQRRFL